MPKMTMTFNLPEERSEYEVAVNSGKYHSVIFEWTRELREKTKYGDAKIKISWQDVSDAFWNLLKDNNVDPYEG